MRTIRAIHIPVDEDSLIDIVELPQGDYKAWQSYVGGTFDVITMHEPESSLVVHDEGKIIGLPLNRRATLMLWTHNKPFRGRDVIMGDVLILGSVDDEGETLAVSDQLVELLTTYEEWRYEVKVIGEDGWHGNQVTYDNVWNAYNSALRKAEAWALVVDVRVVPCVVREPSA